MVGSGEGREEAGLQGREKGLAGLGVRPEGPVGQKVGIKAGSALSTKDEPPTEERGIPLCVRWCGPSWGEVACVGRQSRSPKGHTSHRLQVTDLTEEFVMPHPVVSATRSPQKKNPNFSP